MSRDVEKVILYYVTVRFLRLQRLAILLTVLFILTLDDYTGKEELKLLVSRALTNKNRLMGAQQR